MPQKDTLPADARHANAFSARQSIPYFKLLNTGLQICGAGRKSRKKPMLVVGKKPNGKSRFKTMNETLLSRIGKLFFPRLAPDQRHHRMIIVLLVTLTCLFSAGILISWMMSTRGIHIVVGHSFPFSRK